MQETGTGMRDSRNTRVVLVLPQTTTRKGNELQRWLDEFIEVNSTPDGTSPANVPVGLAGSWQDWVNVGRHLRSAMNAVDRPASATEA